MIVAVADSLPRGVCRGRARYADEAEALAHARYRHATVDHGCRTADEARAVLRAQDAIHRAILQQHQTKDDR